MRADTLLFASVRSGMFPNASINCCLSVCSFNRFIISVCFALVASRAEIFSEKRAFSFSSFSHLAINCPILPFKLLITSPSIITQCTKINKNPLSAMIYFTKLQLVGVLGTMIPSLSIYSPISVLISPYFATTRKESGWMPAPSLIRLPPPLAL